MKIKCVVIDIDGTVTNSKNEVPIENINAISKCIKNNILVVPATGRNSNRLPDCLSIFNFKYIIGSNGSVITKDGVIIRRNSLSKEMVFEIINKLYIFSGRISVDNQENNQHQNIVSTNKITIRASYLSDVNEIINILSKKPNLTFYRTESNYIEIVNKGVSKGAALEYIQNLENLTISETAAIGNGLNDISMFNKSEYSFALENSDNELKDSASNIVSCNDTGGFVDAISMVLSINNKVAS